MVKRSNLFKPVLIIGMCTLIVIGITFFTKHTLNSINNKTSDVVGGVKTKIVELNNAVKMEFVLINPGSFMMGSNEDAGEEDENPVHNVKITQAFYMGKYEVTQEQWENIMGSNPSKNKGKNMPVDSVSWNDCQKFLEKLREKTGEKFDLPTEAQWEYACRAGTTTRWNYGETEDSSKDYGWIDTNSKGTSHPVGKKKANPWGIYDMYGNVQEWCYDWYASQYQKGDAVDPKGPESGDSRVLRGGAWGEDSSAARSAYRNCIGPDTGHEGTGFRCIIIKEN